jgi:negative regulator of sigma E activity
VGDVTVSKTDCTRGGLPDERLSAFLDGDLPVAEIQTVRQHLGECASCAARAGALRVMVGAARALEAPEPPPTLWPAIEGALQRRERWWLSWRPFGVGALAGAAAVAAVVLGLGGRSMLSSTFTSTSASARDAAGAHSVGAVAAPVDPLLAEAEAEFARAAAVYERSIAKLRTLLSREETRWSADERTRYADRLSRLDEAIVRSREAARLSPGDSTGNEELFAAYQQKIAFLTATVHRGGGWGPGTR